MARVKIRVPTFDYIFEGNATDEDEVWDQVDLTIGERAMELASIIDAVYDDDEEEVVEDDDYNPEEDRVS